MTIRNLNSAPYERKGVGSGKSATSNTKFTCKIKGEELTADDIIPIGASIPCGSRIDSLAFYMPTIGVGRASLVLFKTEDILAKKAIPARAATLVGGLGASGDKSGFISSDEAIGVPPSLIGDELYQETQFINGYPMPYAVTPCLYITTTVSLANNPIGTSAHETNVQYTDTIQGV